MTKLELLAQINKRYVVKTVEERKSEIKEKVKAVKEKKK